MEALFRPVQHNPPKTSQDGLGRAALEEQASKNEQSEGNRKVGLAPQIRQPQSKV
jgi:hypothetical protein